MLWDYILIFAKAQTEMRGLQSVPELVRKPTNLGVIFIDVFIVSHLHQPVAEVVVGENQKAAL